MPRTDAASTATIVVTDMVGSTALRTRLGEERADALRRIHDTLLGARVEANGGQVLRRQGDGLVAAFPAASNAVSAAVEMQQAIASYNRRPDAVAEIAIRIGLSVGDVSWEGADCFGTPMVEAARLEASAEGGQILCSEFVRMMARGRGGHRFRPIGVRDLKGLPEPLPACEVMWEPEPQRAPLPLPAELAVGASRPFVSRTAELELAEGVLADPGRDRLGVLWLLGEPGIGKTRLATEIARRAHARGDVVLFGRCSEDLSVPYQPFLEAMRWHVQHVPDIELADRLGGAPGELTRLVPEIGVRVPGLEASRSSSPEIEQHRLFEAVRSWLAWAGVGRPLVVVLDDVHWAARPTLALLGHVARSAEPSGALLVCTARNTSPDDNASLAAVADELQRRGVPSHRLELRGLGIAAVGELVESAAGRHLDERLQSFATELHGDTGGNPLFVDALLTGLSVDPARPQGRLPRTLAETVSHRVSRLPTEVAALLHTASVAGLDFDLRVVARAAGSAELAAVEALESAERAGLVEETGANQHRFRHALVRLALRDELSQSRRVRVHLQVGEALETVHHDHLDEHAAALAYHFSEAVAAGGAPQAYRYTLLAAERATRLLSHEEAADAYGRALGLLDLVEGVNPQARFDLLIARSEAQRKAGDTLGALDTLRGAAGEAAGLRAPEQLARAAIAFEETCFWRGSPSAEALELIEQADAALPDEDSALRALTVASLGRALDFSGRWAEGSVRGEQAASIAERVNDPATSFAVAFRTLRPSVSVEHAHTNAARWGELCRKAREMGDNDAHLLGLIQAMWATAMLGDLAACDDVFGEYSRLAVQLRQPRWEYGLELFPAFRAFLAGDLSTAERFLQRADHVGEGMSWAPEGLHGVSMFLLRREQGRLAELAPALRALVRLSPAAGLWRPGLAAMYSELGMLAEAGSEFDRLALDDFSSLSHDSTRELCLGLLGGVCADLGDAERASPLLEQLRPCEGRLLVIFGSPATLGPTDRILGLLASTAGMPAEAERWHRSGLDLAHRLDSPLWIAHCLHDHAVHLLPSDALRARRMLAESAAICDRHGLAGLGLRVANRRA